jgi:WD40 repeat protein
MSFSVIHRNRQIDIVPQGVISLAVDSEGVFTAALRKDSSIDVYNVDDAKNAYISFTIPARPSLKIKTVLWIPYANSSSLNFNSNYPKERLICATLTGYIIEWDLSTLQEKSRVNVYGGGVHSIAISPNHKYIACACDDGSVQIFNSGYSTENSSDMLSLSSSGSISSSIYSSSISFISSLPQQRNNKTVAV